MPLRRESWLLIALAAVFVSPAQAQSDRRAGAACNRRCLLAFLTEYTEALTDNDLSRLAVADDVRVTSNGTVTELGKEQAWGPARRLSYRQTFVDPVTGAAVFYGVVPGACRRLLT